jgi:hypothetical protein
MTVEEVIQQYRKKFGEYPKFNGSQFDEPYPIERVLAAIETGIKIDEPELSMSVKA